MIGKISRVALREIWRHEAHDFTRWLEDNIEVLAEALDLPLANVERERSAGTFSVDLVAEDDSGNIVVIENQLEKSDHDHLGKLITYLTWMDAQTAIWVVAAPRPEHVKAISWLNEASAASFYLVKVEAIKIDECPAAPLFTLITGPSEEAKEVGTAKRELAARHIDRKRFWTGLLERSQGKTSFLEGRTPGKEGWIGSGSGLPSGLSLVYVVHTHGSRVELYIDRSDSAEWNRETPNRLMEHKEQIEQDFGGELKWDPLEARRACRISGSFEDGGWQDEESWPAIQDTMIDAMIRLDVEPQEVVHR